MPAYADLTTHCTGPGPPSTGILTLFKWRHRASSTRIGSSSPSLSGVGFLREAREKCLSTGHYLSQALDFMRWSLGAMMFLSQRHLIEN